jgi:hypothetical protein
MVWVVNLGCPILGLGVRFLGFGLWGFNIGNWPLVYIEFGHSNFKAKVRLRLQLLRFTF